MTRLRALVAAAAIAVAVAVGVGLALPAPAAASCAGSPPPAEAVFIGTVTAADHGGRRATVKTDDGKTVIVVGTPNLGAGATSADRIFAVGGRYEFHTLNATTPYRDNACTNTRQIGVAPVPDAPASRSGLVVAIGGGAIALSGLAVLLLVLLRSRRTGRSGQTRLAI